MKYYTAYVYDDYFCYWMKQNFHRLNAYIYEYRSLLTIVAKIAELKG